MLIYNGLACALDGSSIDIGMRLINIKDTKDKKSINNPGLSAQSLADLYRRRWEIELFLKWIKLHQRTSPSSASLNQLLVISPQAQI